MEAQAIINILNGILNLADSLDNAGGGVKSITNGERTSREVLRLELGIYLLDIANGADVISDGQAAFMSLVFDDKGIEIPAWKYKQIAKTTELSDPETNVTFAAFIQGDLTLSLQNKKKTTTCTDMLLGVYDAFGQLMVAFNENPLSKSQYEVFMRKIRARVARELANAGTGSTPEAKKASASKSRVSGDSGKKATKKQTSNSGQKNDKKPAASRKKSVKNGYKYDERVSFDLPKGYVFEDGVNDDGDRSVCIHINNNHLVLLGQKYPFVNKPLYRNLPCAGSIVTSNVGYGFQAQPGLVVGR